MAGNILHHVVFVFVISQLFLTFNASPSSRTGNLFHGSQVMLSSSQRSHQTVVEAISGRTDFELNDYSGSAANNRHTPQPPPGEG